VSFVSTRDRELAAVALQRHFVSGRLSLEEFGERVRLALQASDGRDLRRAFAGLPPVWRDRDEIRRLGLLARRGAVLALVAIMWLFVNALLLIAFTVTALAHGVTVGDALVFLLAWLAATLFAWLAARRA
jgi:uncharacterized protein DUF1707